MTKTRPAVAVAIAAAACLASLLLALGLGASGAGAESPPSACCYEMTVWAFGGFTIDYGSAFDGRQKHGVYSVIWAWSTKTIAAYARRSGLVLQGPGLVDASFTESGNVSDVLHHTSPPFTAYDRPESCVPADFNTPGEAYARASSASRNLFAELDGSFRLTPGRRSSDMHGNCPQVDGPDSHGLRGDPSQSPFVSDLGLKRRLSRKRDFSAGCYQSVSVQDPNPTPHQFTGNVEIRVEFDYFPPKSLDNREEAIRHQRGRKPSILGHIDDLAQKGSDAIDGGPGGEDCGT